MTEAPKPKQVSKAIGAGLSAIAGALVAGLFYKLLPHFAVQMFDWLRDLGQPLWLFYLEFGGTLFVCGVLLVWASLKIWRLLSPPSIAP